jgi:D-glycero-D-manno-heptose 1,7-bisphosphate phosphatase
MAGRTPRQSLLSLAPDDGSEARAGTPRPAAFLDRDGVLNELVPDRESGDPESPLEASQVRLVAGAAGAARELARAGFALVCISNQPAAAKGKTTVERLQEVHQRVIDLLACERVHIDATRLCLHHPDGLAPALSGTCDCRKPQPGMLLDAAGELGLDLGASWMIGDTDTDVQAGHNAGCRTILIEYPGSAHKRTGGAHPEALAPDLARAATLVLRATVPSRAAP